MKIIRFIFSPLWKIWLVLWFVIPFLILFPVFYYALVYNKLEFAFKLKRIWARIICIGTFLYPRIHYISKKYKLPQPCIIVPNHTSYLDIVFSPFFVDHTASFMAKIELMKIPLFKYFFVYLDIPVNRKSMTGSHKAFADAGKKLTMALVLLYTPKEQLETAVNFVHLKTELLNWL